MIDVNKYKPRKRKISSPNIYVSKHLRHIHHYDPDGLFSEVVFGPIRNFRCSCGTYASRVYDGKVCPNCGVICGPSELRSHLFGYIELPLYVLNPYHLINESINRTYIEPNDKEIINIISPLFSTQPGARTLKKSVFLDNIKVDNNTAYVKFTNVYNDAVPIPINSIFSLYYAIRYYHNKFLNDKIKLSDSTLSELYHFTSYIPVLPPNVRPIVRDSSGKPIMHPINRYYIVLISICKKIRKVKSQILSINDVHTSVFSEDQVYLFEPFLDINGKKNIEVLFNIINEFNRYVNRLQSRVINIHSMMFEMLSGKDGLIRHDLLGMTVDFSARATIIPDPSLKPYETRLSRHIIDKLWLPYILYELAKNNRISPSQMVKYATNLEFDLDLLEKLNINEERANAISLSPIVLLGRNPTLWRYGLCGVNVRNDRWFDDKVIGVSPLAAEPYNFDFDGDSVTDVNVPIRCEVNEEIIKKVFGNNSKIEVEN